MRDDFKFFVNNNIPWDGVDLFVNRNGCWLTDDGCCEPVPEGQPAPVHMRLTFAQAQDLFDRLYRAGLRPSEAQHSETTLAATQKHLGDMRALAFHNAGVDKP